MDYLATVVYTLRKGKIELPAWIGQRREMAAKRRQEGGVRNAGLTSGENYWRENSSSFEILLQNFSSEWDPYNPYTQIE